MEKLLNAIQHGMDGVDKRDQYPARGSGFAAKAHYKSGTRMHNFDSLT
jgi:hypothetical protein